MIGLHHSGAQVPFPPDQPAGRRAKKLQLQLQLQQQQQQQQQQVNIVRVAARTAMPIVSSVPKCRSSRRAGGGGPGAVASSRPPLRLDQVEQPAISSGGLLMSRHGRRASHFEREMGIMQPQPQDERVLLIVNDDHVTGGGVPIIGRRVASKSAALMASPTCEVAHSASKRVIDYSQPPTIQVDSMQPVVVPMSSKVVGRRSHRIQQQQQLLHPHQTVRQSHNDGGPHQVKVVLGSSSSRRHSARDYAMPQTLLFNGRPNSEHSGELVPGRYSLVQSDTDSTRSPCTSFCCSSSGGRQQTIGANYPPADYCRDPCCTGADVNADCYMEADDYCDGTCECCAPGAAPARAQRISSRGGSSRLSRATASQQHNPCRANNGYLAHRGGGATHQAPGNAMRPHAYRSSSCSERRLQGTKQTPLAMTNPSAPPQVPAKPHLNFAAINELGLASQQRLSKSIHQLRQAAPISPSSGAEDAASAAVTQMYESLAAELKAKLGNPRTAPILLPPKDYDTLSRRQGKLTGIEMRRSTNPQLVGPSISVPGGASSQAHRKENQEASARSSGRGSQADGDAEQTRLSRSNSSSGLGSISLGANSPSSSSSCGQEEQRQQQERQQQQRQQQQQQQLNKTNPNSQANKAAKLPDSEAQCRSPDDEGQHCGASSDSGHSGGGGGGGRYSNGSPSPAISPASSPAAHSKPSQRGKGIEGHHPSQVSDGVLWNGRVEIPLKVNSEKNGNTYLATKQIIY